VLPKMFNYHL